MKRRRVARLQRGRRDRIGDGRWNTLPLKRSSGEERAGPQHARPRDLFLPKLSSLRKLSNTRSPNKRKRYPRAHAHLQLNTKPNPRLWLGQLAPARINVTTPPKFDRQVRSTDQPLSRRPPCGLLDAAAHVVLEDTPHVRQAPCSHLAGELNGTPRHHLHHKPAVIVFYFL